MPPLDAFLMFIVAPTVGVRLAFKCLPGPRLRAFLHRGASAARLRAYPLGLITVGWAKRIAAGALGLGTRPL